MSKTTTAQMGWASLDASAVTALLTNRKIGLAYSGRRVRLGSKFGTWEMSDKGPLACWDVGAKQAITAEMLTGMHVAVDASEVETAGSRDAGSLAAPVVMGAEAQMLFNRCMARGREIDAEDVAMKARTERVAALKATGASLYGVQRAAVAVEPQGTDARSVRVRELQSLGRSVSGAQPKVEAAAVDPAKMTDREKRVAELRALGASVR